MFSAAHVQQAKKQGLEQHHRLHLASIMVETEAVSLFWYFFETFQVLDFPLQNKESEGQASYGFVLVCEGFFC